MEYPQSEGSMAPSTTLSKGCGSPEPMGSWEVLL